MCGIAGLTGATPETLDRMRGLLRHRGPDGQGRFLCDRTGVGLAHTRLALIEPTDAGRQPMLSPCGRWAIVFSGEIYNHAELRAELERRGHAFRGGADAEVLLTLLAAEGVAALDRLVGGFAFALLDRDSGEILLARDRVGVKPLLWAPLPGGGLAFASEIRALATVLGVDLALDPLALSEFLACLYVPAPRTIHAGIRKLPPGHWLRWNPRQRRAEIGRWWAPRFGGGRRLSTDAAVEALMPRLRAAVRSCLVADVPVGCFLSGGVNSAVVAALMTEAQGRGRVASFTMTFPGPAGDEWAEARALATELETRHTELPASVDLAGGLARMVAAFGEPFGNPTALLVAELSRLARQHVTVALAGGGGDALFAGDPHHLGGVWAARWRRIPRFLRRGVIEPVVGWLPDGRSDRSVLHRLRDFVAGAGQDTAAMYAGWVECFTPAQRQALLGGAMPSRPIADLLRATGHRHPLDAMQETDILSVLPGDLLACGDAMGMMQALDLRLPLLDHRLIEAVGALSAATRFAAGPKTLLRAAGRRLLPAALIDRPKRGFTPPVARWLRQELAPLVAERLVPERMARLGLDWAGVAPLLAEHRAGRRDLSRPVWALLVLDCWHEGLCR